MRISSKTEDTIKNMMSLSAEKIDNFWGNASDKGDLILAYFDEALIPVQITLSLYSSFLLNNVTTLINATSEIKIRRYPILTLASCSTGNVASNRKRLIDAKGEAANLAARIDELTKSQSLKILIESQDIILDSNYEKEMKAFYPDLNCNKISLEQFNLKIRDFEEHTSIYIVKNTDKNQAFFQNKIKIDAENILNNKNTHLFNYFINLNGGTTFDEQEGNL